MANPSKGNTFSSAGRFPSSFPQRSHSPTDETLAVVDVNDPSITRSYGTTSGNIAAGGGGGGGVVVGAAKPECPKCHKTLPTLQAVRGHMQVHTERKQCGSRGLGTLASSRSRPVGGATGSQGEGGRSGGQRKNGKGGSSSSVGRPMFDLNLPVEGAAEPAEEGNVYEKKNLGFDLNEFPADGDEQ